MSAPMGLKVGETYEDGGRTMIVDRVLDDGTYIVHAEGYAAPAPEEKPDPKAVLRAEIEAEIRAQIMAELAAEKADAASGKPEEDPGEDKKPERAKKK